MFTLTDDRSREVLRDILESPYPYCESPGWVSVDYTKEQLAVDEQNFGILQQAYNHCMDTEALTEAGLAPLLKLAKEEADLYPAGSPDFDRTEALGNVILFFEKLGIHHIFDFGVVANDIDPVRWRKALTCTLSRVVFL